MQQNSKGGGQRIKMINDLRNSRIRPSRIFHKIFGTSSVYLKFNLISLLTLAITSILLSSCASQHIEQPEVVRPYEKVYNASFEKVWRAAQIVISRYPIKVNDMDFGVLETATLHGVDAWKPPHVRALPDGLRYHLKLRVLKGNLPKNEATKVIVFKQIEMVKDFFSAAERKDTDGLEESVILYRIYREVAVQHLLEKMTKKNPAN